MSELVNTVSTQAYDHLIGGPNPAAIVHNVTIASGAGKLTRGCVLGRVTASMKCVAVDSGKSTGEQTAYAILAEDVDATSTDIVAPAYVAGCFNRKALTFGGTDTADKHEDTLRDMNIYLTEEE